MDDPLVPPTPPQSAGPAPSRWATNQAGHAPPTYWGDPEPPRPPPPPGTEYASVRRRFAAWLIDLVPLVVLTVLVIVPIGIAFVDAFGDFSSGPRPSRAEIQAGVSAAMVSAMPAFVRASAVLQFGTLVYVGGTWLLFGRSPGMALLGIRIAREEDGGRPGPGRIAVRYAGYLLSSALLLLGFVWAIFDPRKQAWHDKLAGTLVVRDARPDYATADPTDVGTTTATRRRPSIGALIETAWTWYRRAPGAVISSLAIVLIPAMLVQLPIIGALYATSQDQTRETLNSIVSLVGNPSGSIAVADYNLRTLAATAPTYAISALFALAGGFVGTVILAACAAAYENATSAGPAPDVGKTVAARLSSLMPVGLFVGVVSGIGSVLIGLPAFAAALSGAESVSVALVAIAAITLLIGAPVALYASVVWILAVVIIVLEDVGALEAVRRARTLARHRTRWLLGVIVVSTLIYALVVVPVGTLPVAILSEAYLDGDRLPVVIAVSLTGALIVFTFPAMFLTYVEAFRAAREDEAREPLAN